MAAAARRSTLKVPIRFTRTTVSNGASAAGLSFFTVRSAQPMPAQETEAQPLGRLHRGAHGGLVGHVGLHEAPVQLGGERLAALGVEVGDRHARAARHELARGGLAQAARPAGHQRALSVQVH